jgi:hypothetical protein
VLGSPAAHMLVAVVKLAQGSEVFSRLFVEVFEADFVSA